MNTMIKNILGLLLILTTIGCTSFGGNTSANPTNNANLAPPLPTKSMCEQGIIETIIFNNDGVIVWYYRNDSFQNIRFDNQSNGRITRVNDGVFCYDYF